VTEFEKLLFYGMQWRTGSFWKSNQKTNMLARFPFLIKLLKNWLLEEIETAACTVASPREIKIIETLPVPSNC
jgi:hypothetical protein